MIAITQPPDITINDIPEIETVVFTIEEKEVGSEQDTKTYFLSENEIIVDEKGMFFQESFNEYFLKKAKEMLMDSILRARERFILENVELPNNYAVHNTYQLLDKFSNQSLYPKRITPTIEEGVSLVFDQDPNMLYIEIYNTGEIGYIVENTLAKRIVDNKDVESLDELLSLVKKYFK